MYFGEKREKQIPLGANVSVNKIVRKKSNSRSITDGWWYCRVRRCRQDSTYLHIIPYLALGLSASQVSVREKHHGELNLRLTVLFDPTSIFSRDAYLCLVEHQAISVWVMCFAWLWCRSAKPKWLLSRCSLTLQLRKAPGLVPLNLTRLIKNFGNVSFVVLVKV